MALLRNGSSLAMLPIRQIGGGVHADLAMWNRSERRNSSTAFSPLAGIPYGHLAPSSWLLPVKPGGMSSVNFAEIDITATGAAVMGAPIYGNASFTLEASGEGQLIANGSGTAVFGISADASLSAAASMAGTTSFAISAQADAGAVVSISGTTSFGCTAQATAYPLNDASPLRTGSASFSISATLQPYAVGIMSGSTVDNTTLTSTAIAGAVWQAAAAEFTDTGTMGAKLNTASSGGVDYAALADTVWQHQGADTLSLQLAEVWGRLGLDPTKPLVTGETSITFGDIVMAMASTQTSTTVTRQ